MPLLAAHVAAAALVVVGVAVQVFRPLAPEIGPVADPTAWFDPDHLELVAAYRTPRYAGGAFGLAVRVALPLLVAFTPPGRRLIAAVVDRLGRRRPGLAAAVTVVGVLVAIDVVLFPLTFWFGYVQEGVFGFRTQGIGGWLRDWIVTRAPKWAGVAVAVPVAYQVVRRLPRLWPPVLGLLGTALVAVLVAVGPSVLEPLQFRSESLPPGPHRGEVERVVARSGLVVDEIVVVDASRRTTRHNAYVSGLGTSRRIVLYDNLVDNRPPVEVGLVLAHELGHHRNADIPRGVLAGGAAIVVLCYVLAAIARVATRSGRLKGAADPGGAVIALAIVVVLNLATQPFQMWLSRRAAAAADYAALQLTADPHTYLATKEHLARANLSDPSPPRWAYLVWASHPSTVERLTMGERWPFEH
jgi:STE24 endopeptidase